MEAIALSEKLFTVEEYIKFDEENDVRHEFHFGKLYPISGTGDVHNEIVHDIHELIKSVFRQRGCKVYSESVKLELIKNGKYNYPDVMLTCDESDKSSTFIKRHPSLIVEVLSKSTATYDRTDKFQDYKGVPSIQYYLLVESRWQYIELFSRTEAENLWSHQSFTKITDIIDFPKLDFQMSVSDIYLDLNLPLKLTRLIDMEDDG